MYREHMQFVCKLKSFVFDTNFSQTFWNKKNISCLLLCLFLDAQVDFLQCRLWLAYILRHGTLSSAMENLNSLHSDCNISPAWMKISWLCRKLGYAQRFKSSSNHQWHLLQENAGVMYSKENWHSPAESLLVNSLDMLTYWMLLYKDLAQSRVVTNICHFVS